METEELKLIINGQRNEMEDNLKSGVVERENIGYVKGFLKFPNIVTILGARRCGKSFFSWLLSKQLNEKFGYVNFDDERLVSVKAHDLNKILQSFYELHGQVELVILDEVQNVRGWELFANRLRRTKKVIITGSNSKLLYGELATHLTGRHIDFTLYPFSFKEVLGFKPDIYLTEDIARIRKELHEYARGSSFPEYRKFGPNIIRMIYEDMLYKDCIRRYRIKEEQTFREMAKYLVTNFAQEFTHSKLSHLFGIRDVHKVGNYVSYLKDAYALIVLQRFSPKLKQQILAPRKVYSVDHGFCNFLSFKLSRNMGRVYENIVCVELLRKQATNSFLEIFYWKDHQQNEVDFVVKFGEKVTQLIQVCYSLEDPDVKKREVKALIMAANELKCRNLVIISDDEEGSEVIKGRTIKYVPLWKWLLSN